MPNAFIRNLRPNSYGAAVSALVEMLVSAGWSYKASGDGLSGYSSTGKIFTSTAAGALGWNNARAWARVQDPAGRRELVIQHAANTGVRIKCSANAKFTGGAPSATVTPSATDERVLWGGGTDAAPAQNGWFDAGMLLADAWVFQGAAFSAPPYGFWFGSRGLQNGAHASFLMMDPTVSYSTDPDPVVWMVANTSAGLVNTSNLGRDGSAAGTWTTAVGGTTQGCWAHLDLLMSQFVYVQPISYSQGTGGAGGGNNVIGSNPFDHNLDALPMLYARYKVPATLVPAGVKGWSTLAMWTGLGRQYFLDTLPGLAWICYGHLWLRWDGVTRPIG